LAASVFVFMNAALSLIFRLRVHRSLLVAAIRMAVQLALVGLVLTTLFSAVSPLWTGLAALGMVLLAGHEAAQRQERRLSGWWSYGLGTGCMMTSSVLVTVFALLIALRPNPWYDPRYAIPLLGMILGNCMTGIALGLDTLTTSLVSRRTNVEAQLMLGATRREATGPVTRDALRSALMPTINSMAVTGVVSLPGMMTGQILGGVPPAEAVKYQILVMFLIAGAQAWER
jgi:putative ABC transport system permease protein